MKKITEKQKKDLKIFLETRKYSGVKKIILKMLFSGKTITGLYIFNKTGSLKGVCRINELQKDGVPIKSTCKKGVKYKYYYL